MAEDTPGAIEFNLDDLTIGDMEDFEEKAGQPLMSMFVTSEDGAFDLDMTKISAVTIKTLVWIARRQKDPEVEFDSIRNVKISDLEIGGTDPS